jgi:hypothetical protein
MKGLILAIAGLFVDDGSLAVSLVVILAAVGFLASTPWVDPVLLGAAFAAIVIAALLVNVARARHHAVSSEIEHGAPRNPDGTRDA